MLHATNSHEFVLAVLAKTAAIKKAKTVLAVLLQCFIVL